MTLVKAYEISLDRMIILAFRDSHSNRRNEKMIHPVNIHLPIVNGTFIVEELPDSAKMLPDQ